MITIQTEEGLDFIPSHFQGALWPRCISTKATEGRQVVVNGQPEALARFSQADFLDCRISAYAPDAQESPSATQRFMGIQTATPAYLIVMIDLDRCNFKTDRGFNMAYTRVLGSIREKLDASPTVLWSGRGYHIIQPLYSNKIVLEYVKEFDGIPNISLKFLRYVELSLSLKKSDPRHNHTVSFNNCMLRIPGSKNSKNGQTVKLVQKWDGFRPEINYLLAGFNRYIINEKYVDLLNAQKRKRNSNYLGNDTDNKVNWIEHLLQTPIQDHRKYCIWRILIPYLLNIRKLPEREVVVIMKEWLNQCNQLRNLDFNYNQRIRDAILGSKRTGFFPIGLDKLREENPELYYLLQSSLIK